jgi:hypothetical protein
MKSPKTKFVVISAIALASIAGIFVSAQSPTPTVSGQDLPFHLVMVCAKVDKGNLKTALRKRPKDTYNLQYKPEGEGGQAEDLGGTLPPMTTPPPCPSARLNGNATQRAVFANTKELRNFLNATGL